MWRLMSFNPTELMLFWIEKPSPGNEVCVGITTAILVVHKYVAKQYSIELS